MAFYLIDDVPVWFDDESDFAALLQTRQAALEEFGDRFSQNRPGISPTTEQLQPDLSWTELPLWWLSAYPIVSGEDEFSQNEDGGLDGTISGQTLTENYTLLSGTLSGEVNGTIAGQTLSETYSLLPGALSGGSTGTIAGATLVEEYSLISGALTGQVNATINGQVLGEQYALLSGTLSGAINGTIAGAVLNEVYSLLSGVLAGEGSGNQQRVGDDGGDWLRRKKPIPYYPAQKLEEALEEIEDVRPTNRVKANKAKIKKALDVVRELTPPPDYAEAIASIERSLSRVSRSAAKHQGLMESLIVVAIQIQDTIADMQRRRIERRKRDEEAILWLI